MRHFRQDLEHALAEWRLVIRQELFQVFTRQVLVVYRNHRLREATRIKMLLETQRKSVRKLLGPRIVRLRLGDAGAKLRDPGIHDLLTEILRSGYIHQLSNIRFLAGIDFRRGVGRFSRGLRLERAILRFGKSRLGRAARTRGRWPHDDESPRRKRARRNESP